MSSIWNDAGGSSLIQPIKGNAFRLVECQETIATTEIVSNLSDQALLEEMIESSKPPYRDSTSPLHYLLSTPFRYPPLRHGSRFGGRMQPSLFYGGLTHEVTLCERAYYRFYFYHDNKAGPLSETIQTQHTLFEFSYATDCGVKLQQAPFDKCTDQLRDPLSYNKTQRLGAEMRERGVNAFEFLSARDLHGGVNVALFNPDALSCDKPVSKHQCLCHTGADEVSFSIDRVVVTFPLSDFIVNNQFPIVRE